jgi:hypothetical protein
VRMTTYGSACESSAPPAAFPFRTMSDAQASKATVSAVAPFVQTFMGPDGRPMIKAAESLPVHEGTSPPVARFAGRHRMGQVRLAVGPARVSGINLPIGMPNPTQPLDTTQPSVRVQNTFQNSTVHAVRGVDIPGPSGPRSGSPPV